MLRVHCVVPEIRSGNHKQHDFVCDLPLTARTGYGGHSEGETPGPIPNPEAKPFSADGTALVTVWESRTPPDKHSQRSPTRVTGWAISAFTEGPTTGGAFRFSRTISRADHDRTRVGPRWRRRRRRKRGPSGVRMRFYRNARNTRKKGRRRKPAALLSRWCRVSSGRPRAGRPGPRRRCRGRG